MFVCIDVVFIILKVFCICYRGWFYDFGNKFEMYGFFEIIELIEYDLNYGNVLYLLWGKFSVNC